MIPSFCLINVQLDRVIKKEPLSKLKKEEIVIELRFISNGDTSKITNKSIIDKLKKIKL